LQIFKPFVPCGLNVIALSPGFFDVFADPDFPDFGFFPGHSAPLPMTG
jgi:hypothetical protein